MHFKDFPHPFSRGILNKTLLIMNFTTILLLFAFLNVNANGNAQGITLVVKNAPFEEMLRKIKEQTGYSIVYRDEWMSESKRTTVNLKNVSIELALSECFKNQPFDYSLVEKTIVLREKLLVPTVKISNNIEAPAMVITGKVTDENNVPLLGVNIGIKNTKRGTTSDARGQFTVDVPSKKSVLIFSFVGYTSQEIVVNEQTSINVKLQPENTALSNLVVTALGIKREKKALGYSVGEVKGELLNATPQTNVLGALQGKVTGVRISQMDGTVGSSVNIIIRGAKSLSNDNQPLFVIDGVPVANQVNNNFQGADLGNAISDLNPDDVESVSVLKGASAAALYGSRAGNGVILITTKSSAKGKGIGVSVNSSGVFDAPYDYYPYQSQFGTGKAGAHLFSEGDNETWGSQLDKGENWSQWNSKGVAVPLKSYNNRIQDFMRTGATLTNNISFNGANDKGFFRVSLGDMRNTGMIPNTDMKRSTINLNAMQKLSDKLSVIFNVNWTESGSGNRPNINGDDRNDVIRSLYEKGAQVNITDLKQYWMPGLEGIQQISNAQKQNNAYFVAYENTNAFTRDRLMSKVQLDYKINDAFTLMGRFTRDAYTEGRQAKKAFSTYGQTNGGYEVQNLYRKETNFEASLSYKKKIGSDWHINGLVAANRMYQYSTFFDNTAGGLVLPALFTISNGIPGNVTYSSSWSQKAIYSVYGMGSLDYKEMAFLDVTARNDWSSTLPVENRSYFYPSASLSLLPSVMFNMPKWISYSKVRAGLAQVGSDVGPYSLNQNYSVGSNWGSAMQIFMGGGLGNPTLKPEQAISKEIGAEFKFFKNRLGFDVTYYNVQNKNQVLGISTPIESGATSKLINTGLIEAKGWEIGLSTTPIISGSFRWDMNFNFTRNVTYLKELAAGLKNVDYFMGIQGLLMRTYVGGKIGDMYENPMLKVTDKSSPYYDYPIISSAGKYQNDNDPTHVVKIGNSNQDFVLAFQPTLTYKAFSLYANVEWNQGGQFYSQTRMFMNNNGVNVDNSLQGAAYDKGSDIVGQIKANPYDFFGNWVGGRLPELGGFAWPVPANGIPLVRYADASFNPGVRAKTVGGVTTYTENLGAAGAGTVWLDPFNANQAANRYFANRNTYSATYVKLREIAFTYRFPKKLLQRINIQKASISAVATNIFEWTKAGVHVDPERAYKSNNSVWTQGVEYYNMMPWTGSVGCKLNVDF